MRINKKALLALVGLVLAAALIVGIVVFRTRPKAPFADLQAEDVTYMEETYGAFPPYRLKQADQDRLIELLRQVEVRETKEEPLDYDGGVSRMFILHMTNGDQTVVAASSPHFFIDDVAYQCDDYETCEAISQIYTSYEKIISAESEPVPVGRAALIEEILRLRAEGRI